MSIMDEATHKDVEADELLSGSWESQHLVHLNQSWHPLQDVDNEILHGFFDESDALPLFEHTVREASPDR